MTLEEIKRLCDAATPGPWMVTHDYPEDSRKYTQTALDGQGFLLWWGNNDEGQTFYMADADFIVTARTELPRLIDLLERAVIELQKAEKHLAYYGDEESRDIVRIRQLIKEIEG